MPHEAYFSTCIYQLFPEPPLDMSVTEGSDHEDIGGKQETPDSDTVKCELLLSGSGFGAAQDEPQCHTITQTGNKDNN